MPEDQTLLTHVGLAWDIPRSHNAIEQLLEWARWSRTKRRTAGWLGSSRRRSTATSRSPRAVGNCCGKGREVRVPVASIHQAAEKAPSRKLENAEREGSGDAQLMLGWDHGSRKPL